MAMRRARPASPMSATRAGALNAGQERCTGVMAANLGTRLPVASVTLVSRGRIGLLAAPRGAAGRTPRAGRPAWHRVPDPRIDGLPPSSAAQAITIRRADPGDAAQIAAIYNEGIAD